MFFSPRLLNKQLRSHSLLCVGLDTDETLIPRHLGRTSNSVVAFNRAIIDATADLVCSYKLNLAFYEAMGKAGWGVMEKTLDAIPRGIISIGDAKRGDLGNSAKQYAKALFDGLGFDAVTVYPYMGHDSIEPFLERSDRGVFLLALTSNPSSKDFQRLKVGGRPLYERVVQTCVKWNSKKNIGLVVGATHPKELQRVRKLAPNMPILIPGIGKQGGNLKSAIRYGCTNKGNLAIINASRSIIYASRGKDFAAASRREAMKLRNEIELYRKEFFG